MSDQTPQIDLPIFTDAEAKEIMKLKPHPRITEESIKARIAHIAYTVVEGHGMLCIITMKNGWMSTGFSAPADPRNFDEDIGKRYAYDHAFKPLWQLEGYLLRDKLHQDASAQADDIKPDHAHSNLPGYPLRPFQDAAIVPSDPPIPTVVPVTNNEA